MEERKYNQVEMLELINQYYNTDRKTIKLNLRRLENEYDINRKDIMELGYKSPNVYSWFAPMAPNIPMFDQALTIACKYDFDVQEFLQEIEID